MVSNPTITSSDVVEILRLLIHWADGHMENERRCGTPTPDLNSTMSKRIEYFMGQILQKRYPDARAMGGAGEPDILFPSFNNHCTEIKVISHGTIFEAGKKKRKKYAQLKFDVTSWEEGTKDIICFIRKEDTLDEWMVVRYPEAQRSWFGEYKKSARGKAPMYKEHWLKERSDLIGKLSQGRGVDVTFDLIGCLEEEYDPDIECYIAVIEDHTGWG